jgi:uncharacterized GH25 family protein
MRRIAMQFGLILALFAFALPARAIELISIANPFHAHKLAGVVVDDTGTPVPGVVVDECAAIFITRHAWNGFGEQVSDEQDTDCNLEPKHILSSTITDANGRFAFPHQKQGSRHYLYLHSREFDPMKIIVKIHWYARRTLRIEIHVRT